MSFGAPELEAAAVDAIVGETTRASRHALPLGAPCPNCATPLAGPWCHECGQKGEEFHRNIWHLVAEAFEGLTHFDSRLWNTLPRLILRPGKLTLEYLEGHRASQIPPFRMFLIVLLLVFFAGGLAADESGANFRMAGPTDPIVTKDMTPQEKAQYEKGMADVRAALGQTPGATAVGTTRTGGSHNFNLEIGKGPVTRNSAWLRERLAHAMNNPQSFFFAVEQWGHRFAILLLPIAALMLTVLFALKKGVYVFDHVIFSMHSLSFVGLLLTIIFLVSIWWSGAWILLWLAPIHLFFHMRGTYRIGVFGTLARMTALAFGTFVFVSLLISALVLVGLATAR